MTEVLKTPLSNNLYDLFIEAVEDSAFPLADDISYEVDQHYVDNNLRYKKTRSNNDLYSNLFKAFQKVNIPLSESTDSLSSALSNSSLSNSSSQHDFINSHDVYHALTKFNGLPTDSTNSLASMDSTPRFKNDATQKDNQTVITQFFQALEAFLQQKEATDSTEPFPKFC